MPVKTKEYNVSAVLDWRRRAKLRLIASFGGSCGICGYNKCVRNLVFHHLDPSLKDKGFGHYQSLAWDKIVAEIRKCVMLCHNCHGEFHDGLIIDLSRCPRFDEAYASYKNVKPKPSVCQNCGGPLPDGRTRYCKRACFVATHQSNKMPSRESLAEMLPTSSRTILAARLGVTTKTLRKWAHKLDVPLHGVLGGRVGFEPTWGLRPSD